MGRHRRLGLGLSRIMDYLETDRDIDARHVALIGHSRLGKTALWAGARDERFALVISNDSGCGGAWLARRQFGETPARISTAFPHWFCKNTVSTPSTSMTCPSISTCCWPSLLRGRCTWPVPKTTAGPTRTASSFGQGADPVYRLLGTAGLPAADMPAIEQPVARHDFLSHPPRQT